MSEYKKSYKLFILWIIAMIITSFLPAFLYEMKLQIMLAIVDNILTIDIFLLTLIIYLTESIYWYNGTTFEQARDAGSERRKAFAAAHMKRFGIFALAFLIYSIISIFIGLPSALDVVICVIGIVAVALSTIKIKL